MLVHFTCRLGAALTVSPLKSIVVTEYLRSEHLNFTKPLIFLTM
jgi:hypothetical protein